MLSGRKIRIAGPQTELRIGHAVEHARTHLFVRQRVQDAVQLARPNRRRRAAKPEGKWPGDLSMNVL